VVEVLASSSAAAKHASGYKNGLMPIKGYHKLYLGKAFIRIKICKKDKQMRHIMKSNYLIIIAFGICNCILKYGMHHACKSLSALLMRRKSM